MKKQDSTPQQRSRAKVSQLAAGVLVGLCAAIPTANADAILYPYFSTLPNVVNFLSVVNQSDATQLHWTYRYDDPNTPDNDCLALEGFGMTEPNDAFDLDISGTVNGGNPLSGDTNSTGFLIGQGFSGLMTLYSFTGAYPGAATPDGTLAGELAYFDLSTGEFFKYRAHNDPASQSEGNLDDLAYGASGGNTGTTERPILRWANTNIVSTEVLVVVADQFMASSGVFSMPSASVSFADRNGVTGRFFDVNSNMITAPAAVEVTCFTQVPLSAFLPGAALAQAAGGGWADIQIVDLDLSVAGNQAPFSMHRGILVYKMESMTALGGNLKTLFTSANRVDY